MKKIVILLTLMGIFRTGCATSKAELLSHKKAFKLDELGQYSPAIANNPINESPKRFILSFSPHCGENPLDLN